jgi:hypothetical protein
MSEEKKILFENIKIFRHIINEAVGGDAAILDAIENHEWIYLYYAGDENSAKGYRTIRPYVLGTNKSGNKVLRAWQDNKKNSWHFDNKPTRDDSKYHDYWTDHEGEKPGWRMFRVDKISQILPIGRKFVDSNGNVMIPSGYREGDDDNMTSIIAYVSTDREPEEKITHAFDAAVGEPEQTSGINWNSIARGNKNRRKITKYDVETLSRLATKFHKRSKGNYVVVIDDKNQFQLLTQNQLNSSAKKGITIPDNAIVGRLSNLYDTLVRGKNEPVDDTWFKNQKQGSQMPERTTQEPQNEIKENNLPSIPFDKKSFFKQ